MVFGLDPALFLAHAVDAETREFNLQLEAFEATLPSIVGRVPQVIRDERRHGRGVFPPPLFAERAEWLRIPGPAGEVPLRVLRPDGQAQGVYLHIHGGGWTLGAADMQDPALEELMAATRMTVVSVDYRLAPEHPYPAGPDDCEAAARWLAEYCLAEFGTDRLTIGGESAGAHLSVVTLLRLRDRHGFTGFAGANLVFGAYDLSFTPSTRRWGDRELVLSLANMEWFTGNFAPLPPEERRSPDISPLYADLENLPRALFSVGTLDPLLDDSLFMAMRWLAAGNRAELAVYPGAVHGFTAFPTGLTRRANARMYGFLVEAVNAPA